MKIAFLTIGYPEWSWTMFHCFGMVLAMTASVTHGTTMSPMPAFSPRRSLACINKERITAYHSVS